MIGQQNFSNHSINFVGGSNFFDPAYKRASFACGCILLPIALFGLVGNLVTVWIFGRKPTSINVLLVGLACFDTWLLLTATPIFSSLAISALYEARMRALWGFLTLYFYPLAMAAQSASAWTMILISIDRYFAVCRPFLAMVYCTVRRSKISLAIVLALALVYNACRYCEYSRDATYPLADFELVVQLRSNPLYKTLYVHWMYLLFVYAVPLAFLVALNSLVVAGLRKAAMDRRHMSCQQHRENRTSSMMLVVVVAFLACNSLAFVLNALETAPKNETNPRPTDLFYFLTDFNNLLVEFNSCVNCAVYYTFSRNFRVRFNRLFWLRATSGLSRNESCRATITSSVPTSYRRGRNGEEGTPTDSPGSSIGKIFLLKLNNGPGSIRFYEQSDGPVKKRRWCRATPNNNNDMAYFTAVEKSPLLRRTVPVSKV